MGSEMCIRDSFSPHSSTAAPKRPLPCFRANILPARKPSHSFHLALNLVPGTSFACFPPTLSTLVTFLHHYLMAHWSPPFSPDLLPFPLKCTCLPPFFLLLVTAIPPRFHHCRPHATAVSRSILPALSPLCVPHAFRPPTLLCASHAWPATRCQPPCRMDWETPSPATSFALVSMSEHLLSRI